MNDLVKELNIPESISNMIEDIANGICGTQILSSGEMLKTKKSKLNDYIPKTQIPSIINDIVTPVLKEIHKSREWQGEKEFFSNGSVIKLIYWELSDDWCIIQMDKGKELKVNKKWFRELYENRKIINKKEAI